MNHSQIGLMVIRINRLREFEKRIEYLIGEKMLKEVVLFGKKVITPERICSHLLIIIYIHKVI